MTSLHWKSLARSRYWHKTLTCLGGKHIFQCTQQVVDQFPSAGQLRGEGGHLFLLSDNNYRNAKLRHSKVTNQNPKTVCGKKEGFTFFQFWLLMLRLQECSWINFFSALLTNTKLDIFSFHGTWHVYFIMTCRSSENRDCEMTEITRTSSTVYFFN